MQPVRYMVANGFTEFRPNNKYPDVSPFSAMDGTVLNSNDEFPETEEVFLEFSNASGKKKAKSSRSSRKKARLDRRDQRRSKREERRSKREERKDRKLAIKEQDSETQKKVAETVGQTSPEEALLMQQLVAGDNQLKTTDATQPEGMSKGLKIGLIVGGVVLLGVATFLVIRKMKKNKK